MDICFVTPELAPFAKVGGLADVSASLPKALSQLGHNVRVILPLYGDLKIQRQQLEPVERLSNVPVQLGDHTIGFRGYSYTFPGVSERSRGPELILIKCAELFDRPGVYTQDHDEYLRFLFLTKAALVTCQYLQWSPDVVHCNDWQTALIPLLLKTVFNWDALFQKTKSVLTIHNIGHQGTFPADIVPQFNLGENESLLHQEDLQAGIVNILKTGLFYADALTTVSPTYAQEIQSAEFGVGLETVLTIRQNELYGILNGIDHGEWHPETDELIPARFSRDDLSGKLTSKRHLLREIGVTAEDNVATIGIVSRLTFQKGFDLLFDVLPDLLATREMRLVVLGSGASKYVDFFNYLRQHDPAKVGFYHGFSNELAHWIEAGSDMFLMPSKYEPCGLNQMYSLTYGTIPIVRKTGGLADTVELFNPETRTGNGIVFDHFTSDAARWALGYALDLYDEPMIWDQLVQNAMSADYSWATQARKYVEIYESIMADVP